jgi:hypothetical protein
MAELTGHKKQFVAAKYPLHMWLYTTYPIPTNANVSENFSPGEVETLNAAKTRAPDTTVKLIQSGPR